jgi:hypothetical protein
MSPFLAFILIAVSSFAVDCIPVFAPPAWTLMMFFMVKFDLNPWIAAATGTIGTVSGRMVYSSLIVPWVGDRALGRAKNDDLKYLGRKLSARGWAVFLFVLFYSLLPLSTTALFTAAGLAKVKKSHIIPPFFLGNLIGDGIILISGKQAISEVSDIYRGSFSGKNIALMLAGLAVVSIFILIDWWQLLERKKLRMKWAFWR